MNRGGVSAARVAHLYRNARRRRGAALGAMAAYEIAQHGRAPHDVFWLWFDIYNTCADAFNAVSKRRNRIHARIRLARANGWGSAGRCPAGHDAKKPAAQALVCGDAAAPNQRVYLAGVTVPGPMVGVSDGA